MKENNELIMKFVNEFANSVPTEENELINSYEEYIKSFVKIMEEKGYNRDYINEICEFETENNIKLPLNFKKQKIILDTDFSEIKKESAKAYKMAQEIILGEKKSLTDEEIENIIQKLNMSLEKVRDFNKIQATKLVSETIMDLNFIKNPNTPNVSIRLSRQIKHKDLDN